MTQTSEESDSLYPTPWVVIFEQYSTIFESRQLSDDTYQLRSPYSQLTINAEGYNLFMNTLKDDDPDVAKLWNDWLKNSGCKPVRRKD